MNSGHNGSINIISAFLNHPEVIADFGWRAAHVEAILGKDLIKQFYGRDPEYNYFVGCSTAARQGLSTATLFPDDFDGMVLGAPSVEWVRIASAWYLQAQRYAWPNVNATAYVSYEQFAAIAQKTIELYDEVDGVKDGVLDDPTRIHLDPQIFACGNGIISPPLCLKNAQQVRSVRLAYEPMVDLEGHFVYPGFTPGADPFSFALNIDADGRGNFSFSLVREYFRGLNLKNFTWDDRTLSIADIEAAVSVNIGLTNTGIEDVQLGAYREAGGKILSYHGRADGIVPLELTEWLFNGIAGGMNVSPSGMQDFYRVFMIPGMGHCDSGPGA